jgi:hypothetical protein
MAGGVALLDYNHDGKLDIFFTNGADIRTLRKSSPKYWNRLFQNQGSGRFVDVTEMAGLTGVGYDTGVAIADYDNDGYPDIFVGGVHRNTLYHNNRDGTFSDVTEAAGLNKPDKEYGPLWSVGGAWFDANNDGLLDLFVLNYLSWDIHTETPCEANGHYDYCHPKFYKKTPNRLYLNNGDGTFRDASAESGIRAYPGKGMGIGVADYDGDGWMDVFITNDKLYNSFFHNKGGGMFQEVAFQLGVALSDDAQLISGMGVDFRDIDNDGAPDIVFVALNNETFPLFKNVGRVGFRDITARSRLAAMSTNMGGYSPTVFDFDNDGWKDLFVTRGHVQSLLESPRTPIEQYNTVFRNLGNGAFQALTEEAGLNGQRPARHRGSAVGDLNGDGRLDVVVSALSAPAEIWMNSSGGSNHWLELSLEGVKSNRDGVGARIKVVSRRSTQFNHMTTAVGYASSSDGPVHFGLGPDAVAQSVEIRWPSGIVQQLSNVAADQVLKVKEPVK